MTTERSSAIQRKARLSAALRENLKRRKAQARGRAALQGPREPAAKRKTRREE
jgi:hypothetical protein